MTGFTLFDSQIVAAYAMQSGKIAQLPTGEGKTLAAVLVAAASALQGRHVHIFTVNDYLAIRDYETSCEIFCRCGLTSSCIIERSSLSDKKKAYESEILYITAKQAGFDYLRNFLCMDRWDYLRNPFDMVLIDEADSILIDEAAIPLVIAADSTASQQFAVQADSFVRDLDEESLDFAALSLTESGINRAEAFFQVDNLYALENIELLTAINDALEAHYRLRKNVDYIIKDRQIFVVDQTTGRTPKTGDSRHELHLAVELKEHLQPGQITTVCNSMPLRFCHAVR